MGWYVPLPYINPWVCLLRWVDSWPAPWGWARPTAHGLLGKPKGCGLGQSSCVYLEPGRGRVAGSVPMQLANGTTRLFSWSEGGSQ